MLLSEEENEEDEDESLPMTGEDWSKIGDEFFGSPVAIYISPSQVIKENTTGDTSSRIIVKTWNASAAACYKSTFLVSGRRGGRRQKTWHHLTALEAKGGTTFSVSFL